MRSTLCVTLSVHKSQTIFLKASIFPSNEAMLINISDIYNFTIRFLLNNIIIFIELVRSVVFYVAFDRMRLFALEIVESKL